MSSRSIDTRDLTFEADYELRNTGRCLHCGGRRMELVKINEDGMRTKVTMWACTNRECFQYIDISKLETWQPK